MISSPLEVFGAPSTRDVEDGFDARFAATGFGRAARSELALQPAVSVAKRSASLCSVCGVGLTCKGFMYYSFLTPKHRISSKYIAVSTIY